MWRAIAARCEALPVGSPARSGRTPRPARPAGLSARELEVLRLVAAGKSNPEIGDELVLSVRTVERHLANLYHRIGAHSRSWLRPRRPYSARHSARSRGDIGTVTSMRVAFPRWRQ